MISTLLWLGIVLSLTTLLSMAAILLYTPIKGWGNEEVPASCQALKKVVWGTIAAYWLVVFIMLIVELLVIFGVV